MGWPNEAWAMMVAVKLLLLTLLLLMLGGLLVRAGLALLS